MAQLSNNGVFVPTTNVWDPSVLQDIDVTSPEFKQLFIRLYQNINLIAVAVNMKNTGLYDVIEYPTGQTYFPNPINATVPETVRNVFRIVVNFGPLPNATTKSVPHGLIINSSYIFTAIYGTASNTTSLEYIPIPYSSCTASADNVELYVDSTYVNIITGSNLSAYNQCYVVLEYIKY